MRKWLRIMFIVLLVAGACVVAWNVRPSKEPEPTYRGKALSVWLDDYWLVSHGDPQEEVLMAKTNQAVDTVVRQIGTNAIPTLFRMLIATDSPFRKLANLARDHGVYNNFNFNSTPAIAQNIHAGMGFRALGADAKDAVPRLINMYNRRQDANSQEIVALALGGIGPPASNAVPSLLRALANTGSFGVPYYSLRALGEIHAEPEKVVPVMIKLLKDPDVNVRMMSILNLQAFGTEARQAVPALVELLTDQGVDTRKHAAQALRAIDAEAAAKAGVP